MCKKGEVVAVQTGYGSVSGGHVSASGGAGYGSVSGGYASASGGAGYGGAGYGSVSGGHVSASGGQGSWRSVSWHHASSHSWHHTSSHWGSVQGGSAHWSSDYR